MEVKKKISEGFAIAIEESLEFKSMHMRSNLRHDTEIYQLKVKQIKALKAAMKGDVLGILATGFGKTDIHHAMSSLPPYLR